MSNFTDAAALTSKPSPARLDSRSTEHGFVQFERRELTRMGLSCSLWKHEASGAEVFHAFNPKDSENCAGIMLCTPASDNRGAPHVLEHLALCGSRKYNQGRPFFDMKKSSCATFVNAATGPTSTTYPFVTSVRQDFQNLLNVYLDAVFHPLIREEDFVREGHHARPGAASGSSSAKLHSGVVYNEMRAQYASPDNSIPRAIRGLLYPDTSLAFDPGGHPDHIVDLTHDDVLRFFDAHYGASNARIFLYGDIPTVDHLRVLDSALSSTRAGRRWTAEQQAARWPQARRFEGNYPGPPNGPLRVAMSWGLGDALDVMAAIESKVVARALLESLDSPLCRAIVGAPGKGSGLFLGGLEDAGRELSFHIGVAGLDEHGVSSFEDRVLSSLGQLAGELRPEQIDRALRQLMMEATEIQPLPSLRLLSGAKLGWLHGGSPWSCLDDAPLIEVCRQRYSDDPTLFQRRIEASLLSNQHRLLSCWRPRASLPPPLATRSAPPAPAAPKADEHPDAPRAREHADTLSHVPLPVLLPEQLPPQAWSADFCMGEESGVTVLRGGLDTDGINYVMLDIDVGDLPPALLALLPRYADMVTHMGLPGQGFEEVERRTKACMAGLACSPVIACHATHPNQTLRRFRVGMKCLEQHTGDALTLLGERLLQADARDAGRLRDVLVRAAIGHRAALSNNPTPCVQLYAMDGISREAELQSAWFGPRSLAGLERLTSELERRHDELARQLAELQAHIACRARWTASFTGSDRGFSELQRALERWDLARSSSTSHREPSFEPRSTFHGLVAPFPVAYLSSARAAPTLGDDDYALVRLGLHIAQFDYFMNAVRTEGGAYGAMSQLDSHHAAWIVSTHSDPDVAKTLRVLDAFPAWVEGSRLSRSDLDRAIVGCSRDAVRPLRPNEATAAVLDQVVRGDSPLLRQRRYEMTRRATPEAVKSALLRLVTAAGCRSICVAASASTIERLSSLVPTRVELEELLPFAARMTP